jgi:hypothetical protein
MRLYLQTFLPRFAMVKSSDSHDAIEAGAVCAGIRAGEVVVFDKAYVDFTHLYQLLSDVDLDGAAHLRVTALYSLSEPLERKLFAIIHNHSWGTMESLRSFQSTQLLRDSIRSSTHVCTA